MKTQKFQKKLSLKKITVAGIGVDQLNNVHGGRTAEIEQPQLDTYGDSCLQSCYFVTCG